MLKRLLLTAALACAASAATAAPPTGSLDPALRARADVVIGRSRVIVRLAPGADIADAVERLGGTTGRHLSILHSVVADVPNAALDDLAQLPGVRTVSLDRRVAGTSDPETTGVGAGWVRRALGYDGSGVGVAIVDSGVAAWHDDLGPSRVVHFVDFVNFQPTPYDDYGHGTHVAGIIAGSGYDSGGARAGVAPGASLIVLKVLDADGQGYISNVIAAIDYAIAHRDAYGIRILNLSVAAGVYESYLTDPLTLAARRAVEAGIVVVSAAGNLGRDERGEARYGGIGAPGNAPWVLTVGAANAEGTADREDDRVASFCSRWPGAIDRAAKPDLVAPGARIVSLTDPATTLFRSRPAARVWGTVATATAPYLSMSGTSMAAPIVSGTIALMLQANPALTPNLVKAILQYTAETKTGFDALTQGAGFLNARGAVELARALAAGGTRARSQDGDPVEWGRHIIWGRTRTGSGALQADASAWRTDVLWGSDTTPDGRAVVWGTACGPRDCRDLAAGIDTGTRPVWSTQSPGEDVVMESRRTRARVEGR
jgi:serine protease AprX